MAEENTRIDMAMPSRGDDGGGNDDVVGRGRPIPKCISKWPNDLVGLVREDIHLREPQKVAMGPCHHGKEHLKDMESSKIKALASVLKLSGKNVAHFREGLTKVEQELRDHYDEDLTTWSSDSFVTMMLVDGCFLLDFLFKLDQHVEGPSAESIRTELLHTPVYPVIIRDLHLLENQIPALVLAVLISVGRQWNGQEPSSPVLHFLHLQRQNLLGKKVLFGTQSGSASGRVDILTIRLIFERTMQHLKRRQMDALGFLRMSFSGSDRRPGKSFQDLVAKEKLQDAALETLWVSRNTDKFMRTATKLRKAGVTFKKSPPEEGLLGVKFHKGVFKGVLYLPELVLDETSSAVLMNMVAFERIHPRVGTEITSFMSFMDILIDTAEDVGILGDAGVITNQLGSDKAAARFFNRVGVGPMCEPFREALGEAREYTSFRPRRWWVHFKDSYLATPWSILSLNGALFLLLLATTQTVYTVVSFYNSKK